jgi:hypothetical protein
LTNRLARLLDSYYLATKQPPPTGLVLVHNQLSSPTPTHEKSFRAWWAKQATEFIPCKCGWRPTLVTITASTDPGRSSDALRGTE